MFSPPLKKKKKKDRKFANIAHSKRCAQNLGMFVTKSEALRATETTAYSFTRKIALYTSGHFKALPSLQR